MVVNMNPSMSLAWLVPTYIRNNISYLKIINIIELHPMLLMKID
jgi:hypothetical protein